MRTKQALYMIYVYVYVSICICVEYMYDMVCEQRVYTLCDTHTHTYPHTQDTDTFTHTHTHTHTHCKYMLTYIYMYIHRCLQCPFEMGDGAERANSDITCVESSTYVDIHNVYLKREILCGVTVVTVGALSSPPLSSRQS